MLFVGDDWAEDHHDVEIVDDSGQGLARRRLPEGLDGVTPLHALIGEHAPIEWADLEPGRAAAMVKVGIETDRDRGSRRWPRPDTRCSRSTRCRWPGIESVTPPRGRSLMPPMRTCWPRSSGWTVPSIGRWPATPQKVRRSS